MKKQAKREHTLSSLSSMPGEVPFCKKQAEREHASSSTTDRMPVLQKRTCLSSRPSKNVFFCKSKLKEKMLCQVCLVKCRFAR